MPNVKGRGTFEYHYEPECNIRMDFDTNENPNIFVSRKLQEQISKYIRIESKQKHRGNVIVS